MKYQYSIFIALMLLVASCAENPEEFGIGTICNIPIEIASTYPTQVSTRASMENGFVADDAVGVFVVDYDKEGNPGLPALKGERAGNIKFTYDGERWAANYQLYWKTATTPADFYGYYPYDQQMESVIDYGFSVKRSQDGNTEGTDNTKGYIESDLLWAKATKVMPTSEAVSLQYKHLMAGITITLEQGTGFTAEEWTALDKTVQIESTILGGTADLSTGSVTVGNGSPTSITPLYHNGTYRAVVFPQTVSADKSIASVTIDGQSYTLKKETSTTYLSGKMHNLTIVVNKTAETGTYTIELIADDIVAWIDDPSLHDGLTYAYTTVVVNEAGKLKEAIDALFDDYHNVRSLKIIGKLNAEDREFSRNNLTQLQNVNLWDVEMEDGILDGFGHSTLQHFVFPKKGVKTISYAAFAGTSLSGPLIIPEGVETIYGSAFDAKYYGTLSLPSTLKYMDNFMGYNDRLTGELLLPEGIEHAEGLAGNFTGSLYFPASLKEVTGGWGYPNMTGTLVIPPAMTEVGGFVHSGCTQVEFHDGVTAIGGFAYSKLSGELVLPPNLKQIYGAAFKGTRITKVIFPDALRIMDDGGYNFEGIFSECEYLMGTVELPRHVARIPAGCFRNCTAITGLVIPEGVDVIDEIAFENCYSLNSIICEDEEPPVICKDAFLGVPKDNFTVEVPKGSVEKYREAPGWKEFKRIAEYSNFVCRPMQANALNTAHTEQLVLNADGAWQVERMPDWVSLSKTSGTGKTELTLTFQQMNHGTGNRSDSIIFTMPDEGHRTFCVVSQYDYEYEEDSYLTLQTHTKGRGIDIVFLGDGYDGEDISDGNYLNLVKEQTEHFFDLEPYKSHRDFFNVYVGFPLSQEKGVNTMNTYVNNHFGTLYGYDGQMCTHNQLLAEVADIREYAVEHTPVTQDNLGRSLIILVPNSDAYEGVTYFEWYGSPISICPPSSRPYPQDIRGVIQHEAGGHGFGRLGDEEITYSAWAPANVKNMVEEKHRAGEYANISTTSGLHNVPWADFVFDTRYSDQVDVFEGGLGYMRGIFRPEQNSCMNYGIPYYNAPSRLSIMRRIFDYGGEHFSMDYFYEHDSNAWGNTANQTTRSHGRVQGGSSYAGSNQHRPPLTIDGKTMSREVKRIREQLKNKNK